MALCRSPLFIPSASGIVPCGQCQTCRINRRNKKTGRFQLESRMHEHSLFVTLTFDDAHLPTTLYHHKTGEVIADHPGGCVDIRTVQLFNKKLKSNVRRKQGRDMANAIRFFACGEYGDKNGRPHYHFVIWNLPYKYREHIFNAWTDPSTREPLCDPDRLDIQVPRSAHDVGQYISHYVMKNGTFDHNKLVDGRPPAFFTSSQGIGSKALDGLIKAYKSPSATFSIERTGDIPRTFRLEGRDYPLDRYMQEKIIAALDIPVPIKKNRQDNFEKEMQALFARAEKNPSIPKTWFLMARGSGREASRYRGWILKEQYKAEKAQAVLNVEKRANLKLKGTSL